MDNELASKSEKASRIDALSARVFMFGFSALIASFVALAILWSFDMAELGLFVLMTTSLIWVGVMTGVSLAGRALREPCD